MIREELLEESNKDDDVISEALENAKKKFNAAVPKGGNAMQYILQWPPGFELSAEVLKVHKGMKGSELKTEGIPFVKGFDRDNKVDKDGKLPMMVLEDDDGNEVDTEVFTQTALHRLYWRIADVAQESRERGFDDDSDEETSAITAMTKRLKLKKKVARKKGGV